jgi:proteasome lid subunit RPN8/RPN11
VAPRVLELVVAHARAAAPEECCGLLLGRAEAIVDAVPTRNVAEQPASRFLIEPKDHIDGRRNARDRGLAVVGFYHSHPRSAPAPSPTDLAEATYPDYIYAIVSLAGARPQVNLFRLEGGRFVPVSGIVAR